MIRQRRTVDSRACMRRNRTQPSAKGGILGSAHGRALVRKGPQRQSGHSQRQSAFERGVAVESQVSKRVQRCQLARELAHQFVVSQIESNYTAERRIGLDTVPVVQRSRLKPAPGMRPRRTACRTVHGTERLGVGFVAERSFRTVFGCLDEGDESLRAGRTQTGVVTPKQKAQRQVGQRRRKAAAQAVAVQVQIPQVAQATELARNLARKAVAGQSQILQVGQVAQLWRNLARQSTATPVVRAGVGQIQILQIGQAAQFGRNLALQLVHAQG